MVTATRVNAERCAPVRATAFFFFSSRRRHTRLQGDWSSDVCSSDLRGGAGAATWCTAAVRPGPGRSVGRLPRAAGGGLGRAGVSPVLQAGEAAILAARDPRAREEKRSEERRVGKEWRSRWSPYH